MYKKILLATAVAAVCAQANAATWAGGTTVTMPTHTNEGMQSITDASGGVDVGEGLIKLGAEYALNDLITFTLSAPKASGSYWPTTINGLVDANLSGSPVVLDASIAEDDATIIFDHNGDSSASTGVFTVGQQIKFASSAQCYRITVAAASGVYTVTPLLTGTLPANANAITNCGAYKDVDLTLVSGDTTSAKYRVSALGTGTTSVGSIIPTPVINVGQAGLASGSVTISFSAETATGTAMDALATALKLGTGKTQFAQTVTGFDGIVDVGANKKKYTGAVAADAVSVKHVETLDVDAAGLPAISGSGVLTYAGTISSKSASVTSVVNTLSGDFSYLDDKAATAGVQVSSGSAATDELLASGTGCTASVSTTGVLKITDDISDSAAACVATVTNTGAKVIPVQAFTNTATYTFTPNGGNPSTATVAAKAAGAWALNGATVRAYGVPMGEHVSRFIWINNKGALDGPFTYTAMMNGASYGPFPLGTVSAKKAMSVGGLIDTDLAARGINIAPSSRATFTFSAPVKQADIVVSASYKHIADADRVALETSDSLNATGK